MAKPTVPARPRGDNLTRRDKLDLAAYAVGGAFIAFRPNILELGGLIG